MSLPVLRNSVFSLMKKGVFFVALSWLTITNAASPIGQPLDVTLGDEVAGGMISGSFLLPQGDKQEYEVEFFLANEKTGTLLWKESQTIPVVQNIKDQSLIGNFDVDVSDFGFDGSYTLFVTVLNEFSQRIALSKTKVLLTAEDVVNAPPEPEIVTASDIALEDEDNIVATIWFRNNQASKKVLPVATIYEDGYRKFHSRHRGTASTIQASEEREFSIVFPAPIKPENYTVVLSVQDESGKVLGGESLKTLRVNGNYGEIIGVSPPVSTHLGSRSELDFTLRGFVSTPGEYVVDLELIEERKDGTKESSLKTQNISVAEDQEFNLSNLFELDLKTKVIKLKASINDTESNTVLEEVEFRWTRDQEVVAPQIVVHQIGNEQSSPLNLVIMNIALLVLVAVLLIVLFLKGRKRHLLLVLGLGGTLFASTASAQLSQYQEPFIDPMLIPSTYTTESEKDIGFRNLLIEGVIEDNLGESIFTQEELETIDVEVIDENGTSIVAIDSVDYEDVWLQKQLITLRGFDVWGYRIYVDITGAALDEESYGVRLTFNFKDKGSLVGEAYPYFKIDESDPQLAFDVIDSTPTKDDKIITIICEDDSNHCIDQPVAGTGALADNDKRFEARVKGNFCDGTPGDNKFCKDNKIDGSEMYKTFEVCDGVGNCAELESVEDFFYYDPFPPSMGVIQLFKSNKDEGDAIVDGDRISGGLEVPGGEDQNLTDIDRAQVLVDGRVLNQVNDADIEERFNRTNDQRDGDPIAAQGRFGLDLLDDKDDQIVTTETLEVGGQVFPLSSAWHQGPAGDPNGCGESMYDSTVGTPVSPVFIAKDYGDGKKGDFYFGPSIDQIGVSKCRQRMVSCSNSPGHRGFWDRSLDPLATYEEEDCSLDGRPRVDCSEPSEDCCGPGYVYNATSGACEAANRCNPAQRDQILADNGGEANVWLVNAGANRPNQTWGFEDGVGPDCTVDNNGEVNCDGVTDTDLPEGVTACSWGCKHGTNPDGSCKQLGCFHDRFPFCFPVCFNGKVLNDNGTPDDNSDDFCEDPGVVVDSACTNPLAETDTQIVESSECVGSNVSCAVACPAGYTVLSGGVDWISTTGSCHLSESRPQANGWTASISSTNLGSSCTFKTQAVCAKLDAGVTTQVVREVCPSVKSPGDIDSSDCDATCPAGSIVVGGGVDWIAADGSCHMVFSKENGANGWSGGTSQTNASTNRCEAAVEAICLSPSEGVTVRVEEEDCAQGNSSGCIASCGSEEVLVGGGLIWQNTNGTSHMTQSHPDGANGWNAGIAPSNTSTTMSDAAVQALCLSTCGEDPAAVLDSDSPITMNLDDISSSCRSEVDVNGDIVTTCDTQCTRVSSNSVKLVTVPTNVTHAEVEITGAGGGNSGGYQGGKGGKATGSFPVTSGEQLLVHNGCGGIGDGNHGIGGALSGIFTGTTSVTEDAAGQSRAIIIAGAGGGASGGTYSQPGPGGDGGGSEGATAAGGSAGGTQSAGGRILHYTWNNLIGMGGGGYYSGYATGGGGGGGAGYCSAGVSNCVLATGQGASAQNNGSVIIRWKKNS